MMLAARAPAQVVVTEIHYHPVEEPAFNVDGTPVLDLTDDVHEFVELQNIGAEAVDLSGWKLAGAVDFTFPAGTSISAGEFRVVAKDPGRLQTVYGIAGVLGPYTGKLSNSGDTVRVRNAAEVTVESVAYSSSFPWPISANAFGAQDRFTGLSAAAYQYKGRSLQRVSVLAGANDPANWLASPLASGPSPGAPQAITRSVPKPVVIALSRTQASDGAGIIRANQPATVKCTFSSQVNLSAVQLEYFVDDMNVTGELRTAVAMVDLGNGTFAANLQGQADRSIVRYRIKANRGDGVEIVSPRADDPAIGPVGPGGELEAWHGYFVTPTRVSANPIYDLLIGQVPFSTMGINATQNPRRVTQPNALGLPREVPYVAANAPLWNGTVPAVFAHNGVLYDVQIRYHGSRYHRGPGNLSFKVHYPDFQPLNNQTSWFVTGHGLAFAEVNSLYRQIGLPSSKMRAVDWYFNTNGMIVRYEQGEYASEMLSEYHELQQQLNPGTPKEPNGELYKAIGNIDGSQNNNEGPYTKADQAPMLANAGWTQLQRYEWTYTLQCNGWKGAKPFRDLIEGMWTVRGDAPSSPTLPNIPANLANTKAWFEANFDVDATLTAVALCQWIGIWDDTGHNQFFWRRANGKWVRLPWDFDGTMNVSRTSQSIYANELGVNVFGAPNWWKDTFFKCYRTEFKQRLWELNNSYLDPANLLALGMPNASSFAATRQANVNTQVGLGTYYKPSRPLNASPSPGVVVVGGALLKTSAYAHSMGRPQASTKWEIRAATGNYEDPVLRLASATNLTSLPVPFDQLTYGQTYFWRTTHTDVDGHNSIVSDETSFTWGTASTVAGTLVLNEILADNRSSAQNGNSHPDYIELRNNGAGDLSLAGLALTDDPGAPAKFTFPAGTTLTAGERLVVWCDSDTSAPGLHSGFALHADGQTVLLLNGANIVDAVSFGPQAPDISIGRVVDGTGGWQANTPTPGAINSAKALGAVANLRINEWMATPAYGEDWFELHNVDANPVALGGLYLSDDPAAPTTTKIPALSFIAGKGFTKFLADGSTAGGHHANFKLGSGGDKLVLTSASGTTTLDLVTFGAQATDVSQGRFPDGAASFVSFAQTASPGRSNWLPAPVVINEALSNSTAPLVDMIELHNPTPGPVDLSGWWLSDDRSTPQKFQIPSGTMLPAGGYTVFSENEFSVGAIPFSLSAAGDEVVLSAVDGAGTPTGYRAQVSFGPAAENVTFGRVNVSGGAEFWPQVSATPGAVNGLPKTTILINEVMYRPPDDPGGVDNTRNEFIELFNPFATAVDVSGWRLKGDSDFTFAPGTVLPPNGYALLVNFDPGDGAALTAFCTTYGLSPATTLIFGPFAPKLANDTQNLELAYPDLFNGVTDYVLVDKVEYRDIAPWPSGVTGPDGTGKSLQRRNRRIIGNDAANWGAALPTPAAVNSAVSTELTIITDSPLPGGVKDTGYLVQLAAMGGAPLYSWSMIAGALPPGLTLSSAGEIAGTPTATGVFTWTAQVRDDDNTTRTKDYTLTVAATPLGIATAFLPDGVYGTAYSQSLLATGGTPPFTWTRLAGSLPGGLTLSPSGVVSGTPMAPGTFHFTLRVADGGGLAAARDFTVAIPNPPLAISTASLPDGAFGVAYSQALVAAGGVSPFTWSISAGALPAGLSLSNTGDLTGMPTVTGSFVFAARVTDSVNTQAVKPFILKIAPAPLVITTAATLPGGIIGDDYAQVLAATGGTGAYTWTITAGSLPPGTSLTNLGFLSGTPQSPGAFAFTARVTDDASVITTKVFNLNIATSGPLHHFTWHYAPPSASAGTPFAVRISARDSKERLVTTFAGDVNLTATGGGGTLPNPVVITEVTDESEDQFELQNVSNTPVNTTGWFVRIGDSTTAVNSMNAISFSLPPSIPAGGLIRVSEVAGADRLYFGGPIGWNTTVSRGWIMLFDASNTLRDFFAFGWTAADLAGLSFNVNGNVVAPVASGQWTGPGGVAGPRGAGNTTDSWSRTGIGDSNTAADFAWSFNTQSFGATNPGLTLPWSAAVPILLSPGTVTFSGGEFLGYLSIPQPATNVTLTAGDSVGHFGSFAYLDVSAPLADTDGDGLPDAWESANGLDPLANDALLDFDRDGQTNRAEFFAGTNPQSPASRFAIATAALTPAGELQVSWPGVAGKLYRVSTSTDLQTWTPEPPLILAAGSGMQTVSIFTDGATHLCVRIEIAP
jgi:hypothetical protein